MCASDIGTTRIQVIEGERLAKGKIPTIVGLITAKALVLHHKVPHRNFTAKTGYQREPSRARINKLVAELEQKRVDLPTAVLLNMRDFNHELNLVVKEGQQYLHLNEGDQLQVVDGQHRIEGLRILLEKDPERWNEFRIPFVCSLGATVDDEMWQFYVVNSTAKSVRTDLALDLLKHKAQSDPNILESLRERGDDWKVAGQTLAEELAKTSELWRGRIRFSNESKAATTVNSAPMVTSLRKLIESPYFGSIGKGSQLKILTTYWQGIRNIYSVAFDSPGDFLLQKPTGVHVMHQLLITVLEHVRSQGKSVVDPNAYEDLLRDPLLGLQGNTSTGEVVTGLDFWRTGADGAAGSYSSNAGRRVLTARIRTPLPEILVE